MKVKQIDCISSFTLMVNVIDVLKIKVPPVYKKKKKKINNKVVTLNGR